MYPLTVLSSECSQNGCPRRLRSSLGICGLGHHLRRRTPPCRLRRLRTRHEIDARMPCSPAAPAHASARRRGVVPRHWMPTASSVCAGGLERGERRADDARVGAQLGLDDVELRRVAGEEPARAGRAPRGRCSRAPGRGRRRARSPPDRPRRPPPASAPASSAAARSTIGAQAGSHSTSCALSRPAASCSPRPDASSSAGGLPVTIALPRAPAHGRPSITRQCEMPVEMVT